jgi:hypothetical protein
MDKLIHVLTLLGYAILTYWVVIGALFAVVFIVFLLASLCSIARSGRVK